MRKILADKIYNSSGEIINGQVVDPLYINLHSDR